MSSRAEPRQIAARMVKALRDAGHVAYFAGGCVRDELLGQTPQDYDIATDAWPQHVRKIFRHTREVGASFGVVLVRERGVSVEVATFREEGEYSDRRRPDHVRYADAPSDARRRDFTINALFLDPLERGGEAFDTAGPPFPVEGRVIDYVNGVNDLRKRVLRAVGDPEKRLAEDHLRALRAVRFTARLGFSMDPPTGEAVRRHATELAGVSRERIGQELRRMLSHPTRVEAALLMERLGLDAPALGEPAFADASPAEALPTLAALPMQAGYISSQAAWELDRLDARAGEPADALRLDSELGAIVARLRAAVCLANDERDLLRWIFSGLVTLLRDWDGLGVAPQKRIAASRWFADALCILEARDSERAGRIRRRVDELQAIGDGLAPAPLISGDELLAMGIPPGPALGSLLDSLYDAQLEGRICDREQALRMATELQQPPQDV